jgi:hypothetical protein
VFYDTPNEKKSKAPEALPKGFYRVMISESEGKDTKAGTGRYLLVTFDVIEGDFKGRKIWHMFNVQNRSEQAQAIGRGQMKALLEAIGHNAPLQYENDFHRVVQDKVLIVATGASSKGQDGEERTRVKDFSPDGDLTSAEMTPTTGLAAGLDEIPF